ncbi:MAG: 4-hydroxy-3-methylbut-2-enyl diphosphate reductase [Ruminococcaceae bacterium]|nr:4-hydroxy-3-methylbut-2-enyl diphosphate reductase [Oscillospiraceae bacterium]
MSVEIAKNAGFCFGVKRATDSLERAIESKKDGERIFTLGNLIHNDVYNNMLREKGVFPIKIDEVAEIANTATPDSPVTLFIRAHGIPKQDEALLASLSEKKPSFRYVDCTCPYVKKIHRIAEQNSGEDRFFLLFGAAEHPEVVGIMSYADCDKAVFSSAEELEDMLKKGLLEKIGQKLPIIASQTTQKMSEWKKSQKIFKKLYTNAQIFDTICSVTELRQNEAEELSRTCDFMIVIGGKDSSNTAKLFSICKKNCANTVWIEDPGELVTRDLISSAHTKVGIAAGASTPSGLIQEVYKTMSEITENFEELLESSLKTLNTGDTVVGTVTLVTDAELQLDLGVNVTGIIKAEQITDDASVKLTEMFSKGDEVEAFVIRVSDIEGVAELSKKRVDSDKNWQKIVLACENGDILEGKVVEVVRGGVIVLVGANRVFVPASQTGVPKDNDLAEIKGNEVKVKVIEIKGNRAIGSIKAVAREERRAKEAAFWASIEEGKVYTGCVKSLTAYGAFVDLGGVDGMVHKTELSWRPIATPAAVVEVGQEITVFVKSFDAEKKRISLGYKTEETNPWYIFTGKYAVGDVASVKIVNMMPFGAFAEIVEGVDGLIHISQIAQQKIGKPADVLELGQVVDAKIIAIDEEKQKVSLSIRALLDEAQAEAEAMPEEEVAEEAAPVEE